MSAQPQANGSKAGQWAIIGVLVGFLLPIFTCVCLTAAVFSGVGSITSNIQTVAMGDSSGVTTRQVSGPATGPAVAVIRATGVIVSGRGDDFGFGDIGVAASEVIARLINEAARNGEVNAIVLFVDSPGGSVVGSDEIYHALKKVDKPVVAYMGSTAASGGYYISLAAQHIVAHPDTLTGSIGVISEFTNIQGLYEKLGLRSEVIKSGEFKDFGNPTSPFTEEDRKLWQTVIDEVYENFVRLVAQNRKMSVEQAKALADGRIYTGRQALALNLVDQLGYFEDAVNEAAKRGGIAGEPRVIEYRRSSPFLELAGIRITRTVLQALGVPVELLYRPTGLQYR
ncbi:MAG: signal peptide peptidase SppA [Anaerolineae bacterium]|nr:signal peptide peptidase SppA [Thermoflexales bacterium]MDW8395650.1 signal peptide peptidase SppA [Anaerolineae bacterium]